MKKDILRLAVVALVILASDLAKPARGSGITTQYSLTPVETNGLPWHSQPGIDEQGKLGAFPRTTQGPYTLNAVYDPNYQGRIVEMVLRKDGSETNLLPDFLRSPLTGGIDGFNAEGILIGHLPYINGVGQPFYLDVKSGQLHDLKPLPGVALLNRAVFAINDLGQIVGAQGGKAILYTSPDAVPVELSKLLANKTDWNLYQATGINNRGEIAGYGTQLGVATTYFKLTPVEPVPEPSSIALFAVIGGTLAYLSAKARRPNLTGWGEPTRAIAAARLDPGRSYHTSRPMGGSSRHAFAPGRITSVQFSTA